MMSIEGKKRERWAKESTELRSLNTLNCFLYYRLSVCMFYIILDYNALLLVMMLLANLDKDDDKSCCDRKSLLFN